MNELFTVYSFINYGTQSILFKTQKTSIMRYNNKNNLVNIYDELRSKVYPDSFIYLKTYVHSKYFMLNLFGSNLKIFILM